MSACSHLLSLLLKADGEILRPDAYVVPSSIVTVVPVLGVLFDHLEAFLHRVLYERLQLGVPYFLGHFFRHGVLVRFAVFIQLERDSRG